MFLTQVYSDRRPGEERRRMCLQPITSRGLPTDWITTGPNGPARIRHNNHLVWTTTRPTHGPTNSFGQPQLIGIKHNYKSNTPSFDSGGPRHCLPPISSGPPPPHRKLPYISSIVRENNLVSNYPNVSATSQIYTLSHVLVRM